MNEKVGNFLLIMVMMAAGFFLLQMCNKSASVDRHVSATVAPKGYDLSKDPVMKPVVMGMVDNGGKYEFPDKKYKVGLAVNPVMTGVDLVLLNPEPYAETPKSKEPLKLMEAKPGMVRPLSVMSVRVKGAKFDEDKFANDFLGKAWTYEVISSEGTIATGVKFYYGAKNDPWMDGKGAKFNLTRTYTIEKDSYDVKVVTQVENLGETDLLVEINQMGTMNLPNDSPNYPSQYVQVASYSAQGMGSIKPESYHKMDGEIITEAFKKPNDTTASPAEISLGAIAAKAGEKVDRVMWVAQGNRFFAAIARPDRAKDPNNLKATPTALPMEIPYTLYPADWVSYAHAIPMSTSEKPEEVPVAIYFGGYPTKVEAKKTLDFPLAVYLGPKKSDLLVGNTSTPPESDDYLKAALHYEKVIKYSQGGPCGFCTFDWLVAPILWLLDVIHTLVRNYGVAILILTLVVRLLLHPLTRFGQTQMAVMQKKMAAIQPEIERVKKRYEKDKKQQQMELMKVYRENNVNPAGGAMGCLPLLLQTPIWLALYGGLATAIALRHAPFIPGWIDDLSNPDTVYKIKTSFHVWVIGATEHGQNYIGINILPMLLGVLYFLSMKLNTSAMPKSTDPTQLKTMKFQQWLFLLFPLFLYYAPSGLNLYMVASTTGSMLDTWLIRKSLRAKGILPAAMTTPM